MGRAANSITEQKVDPNPINPESLLAALEDVAERIGVNIRYEKITGGPIRTTSGFCRLRGENVVLIDRRMSTVDKLYALAHELRRFDLEKVFMTPAARRFLQVEIAD